MLVIQVLPKDTKSCWIPHSAMCDNLASHDEHELTSIGTGHEVTSCPVPVLQGATAAMLDLARAVMRGQRDGLLAVAGGVSVRGTVNYDSTGVTSSQLPVCQRLLVENFMHKCAEVLSSWVLGWWGSTIVPRFRCESTRLALSRLGMGDVVLGSGLFGGLGMQRLILVWIWVSR